MTRSPEDDLDVLMARLADGDRSAFTLVFRKLWDPTRRFCLSLLKNEADASDAAQEAMEKVLSRANDYDRARPAMPWAMAIAAWECRTISRKRKRRGEVSEEAAPEAALDPGEEELVRRDLIRAALEALGELPASDQETLVATFLEQASDVSGATFRKRRERARDRLRNAFRRLYGLD